MLFSGVFVRRPVMAIAINLVLLILGLVAFHQLELRHTPNANNTAVKIKTIYPGANSFAVEHQVTKPIEDAISGLDGIQKLGSSSQDGMSVVSIKLKTGVQYDKALSQIRDRVLSTINSLPEAVKRPEILEESENNKGIMYLVFEDDTRSVPAISDYIRRNVEDRLRLVEGVAALGHYGNEFYTILIEPDPAALMQHGVSVKEVVDAVSREKSFASGGEVEGVTSTESVVISAIVTKPQDFSKIIVKTTDMERVTVGDVAAVSIGKKSTDLKIRVNGRYVMGLEIIAKPQANPLEVAERVQSFIQDLQNKMPTSMHAYVSFNATKPFFEAFTEMRYTLWEAIALVGIIITLSLGSVRAALMPMITVPLCLVGAFALMWLLNFSLNPVTLLALVLAVGLVVDDAIVVVENIYQHLEAGETPLQAAILSMKEISFAVVVMTITLAAVYLPLIFQIDESAVLFREFAWTLAGSVLISGFVALTLTPALCGRFLKKAEDVRFWTYLTSRYQKSLTVSLRHPGKIGLLLVGIALLGVWSFMRLPSELVPKEDEGYMFGSIQATNTVTEAVRQTWYKEVESVLATVPEKERILTGAWRDQWLWWNLILKPREERSRTAQEIIQTLDPKLKGIVGPMVMVDGGGGWGGEAPLKIILQYSGDPDRLSGAIKSIIAEASKHSGFEGLVSEHLWEKPRLEVQVDQQLAAELGVRTDAIEDTLYTFLSGRKATDFNFQGLDYAVEVRAPQALRSELDNLNMYFVRGAQNQWVPLGSLVTLKEVLEPNEIKHYERMRGAAVQVSLKPELALGEAINILEPIIQKHLPKDARFHFGGKAERYQASRNNMLLTFGLALAFIYLVLAALFESFLSPLVVLLTVPLSVTGALLAINWFGGSNNTYTVIGLVTLIGLITKHGVLIVDFANRFRATQSLIPAVTAAATSRLRPVLMTTFAMICGALPLVFSAGSGAVARQHIGWIIIGGMSFGTLFSLFVIPVMYAWLVRSKS